MKFLAFDDLEVEFLRINDLTDGCASLIFKLHRDQATDETFNAFRHRKGKRFHISGVEIADDEQPVPQPAQEAVNGSTLNSGDNRPASGEGIPPTRVRTLPEHIGWRCNQPPFQQWCLDYQGVKGIVDPVRKREWTAQYVRDLCEVESRSEILPGTEAEGKWKWLESAFLLEGHV